MIPYFKKITEKTVKRNSVSTLHRLFFAETFNLQFFKEWIHKSHVPGCPRKHILYGDASYLGVLRHGT